MSVTAGEDRGTSGGRARTSVVRGDPAPSVPRLLQRMGAVTVGVSLPREWVGKRGLGPGTSIFLRTLPDGSLVLRDSEAPARTASAVVIVDPAEPEEHLFRRLIAAYLAGAQEFVIEERSGITARTRDIARSFAKRAAHTESASEDATTLILRDVSNGSGLEVPQLIHRMCQVVLDLQVDSGRSWTKTAPESVGSLSQRDDEVDRYSWEVERCVRLRLSSADGSGSSSVDVGDALRFLLWARDLERIADHAVLIAEHGERLAESGPQEPLRRMLSTYHAQALDHLRSANAVAEAPDSSAANDVLDVGEALHETQAALVDRILLTESAEHLSRSAVRSIGLILQSIDRTTSYSQNIAEIGLDRQVDRLTHTGHVEAPTILPGSISSKSTKRGGTRRNERNEQHK